MASRQVDAATTLAIRRTFPAPRERVCRAWTDPTELMRWWGPKGYETPSAEVDLRAGGRYRLAMRKLPDGEVFHLTGVYQEVRPPERLVYTWRWEAEPELGETLVTVEFLDRGTFTEVALTHERFPSDAIRDRHGEGWSSCLDRLAEVV